MQMIEQVFPEKKEVPLNGLYLEEKLQDLAAHLGRSLVLTDYLTDKNGVVAKKGEDGQFRIPSELMNPSDWGRYQELMAQADVTITGGAHFKRLAGNDAQDILFQFEAGHPFEKLGEWRLGAGFQKRSPDLAIVSHRLDFELPRELIRDGRRIVVFTTDSMADTEHAQALKEANTTVLGIGESGVDGDRMIATLADAMGYGVIMMVSGPRVLELLLNANLLDFLYVTRADLEIPIDDPAAAQTLLSEGRTVDDLTEFHLAHEFRQEDVVTESGSHVSQSFFRYDRKDVPT